MGDEYRAELFDRANAGDLEAIEELWFSYSRWSSRFFDEDRARFWRCKAASAGSERAIAALADDTDWPKACENFVRTGTGAKFHVYIESGSLIRTFSPSELTDRPASVPSGRIWKITWAKTDCPRICTSDIRLNGVAYLGPNREYVLEGELSITTNAEVSILWLMPGTELTVPRELRNVTISELAL